ncbi:MAG: hypothetical protein U5R49_06335 [Deltaproteobacteria bacterium]|nr:hypothetical protein [Deltaproteobacteria bacterium]
MTLKAVLDTNVLISGDKHLVDLKMYRSIRILTAREFYEENLEEMK